MVMMRFRVELHALEIKHPTLKKNDFLRYALDELSGGCDNDHYQYVTGCPIGMEAIPNACLSSPKISELSQAKLPQVCTACPDGSHSNEILGTSKCLPCPTGSAPNLEKTACHIPGEALPVPVEKPAINHKDIRSITEHLLSSMENGVEAFKYSFNGFDNKEKDIIFKTIMEASFDLKARWYKENNEHEESQGAMRFYAFGDDDKYDPVGIYKFGTFGFLSDPLYAISTITHEYMHMVNIDIQRCQITDNYDKEYQGNLIGLRILEPLWTLEEQRTRILEVRMPLYENLIGKHLYENARKLFIEKVTKDPNYNLRPFKLINGDSGVRIIDCVEKK
jgi:hypothetical protein